MAAKALRAGTDGIGLSLAEFLQEWAGLPVKVSVTGPPGTNPTPEDALAHPGGWRVLRHVPGDDGVTLVTVAMDPLPDAKGPKS